MNDPHKAQWIISDEMWSIDANYKYARLQLYVPNYVSCFLTHKDGRAVEFNIMCAKREILKKVFEDLMGTEDWFEKDQD
jgi:hypothetical protein